MNMHPLKRIFDKILWDNREDRDDYELTFLHRGPIENHKTIPFNLVKDVGKSFFIYDSDGGEITIPLHRVIFVKNVLTNKLIWKKRGID